jgi:hypothetical protein
VNRHLFYAEFQTESHILFKKLPATREDATASPAAASRIGEDVEGVVRPGDHTCSKNLGAPCRQCTSSFPVTSQQIFFWVWTLSLSSSCKPWFGSVLDPMRPRTCRPIDLEQPARLLKSWFPPNLPGHLWTRLEGYRIREPIRIAYKKLDNLDLNSTFGGYAASTQRPSLAAVAEHTVDWE